MQIRDGKEDRLTRTRKKKTGCVERQALKFEFSFELEYLFSCILSGIPSL